MQQRWPRSVALLTAGLVFGGCSAALTESAPASTQWPGERQAGGQLARCTSSRLLPLIDGVIALGLGAGAIHYARQRGAGDDDEAAPVEAGALAIPALAFLASAIYGIAAASTCRTYLAGSPYPPAVR